MIKSYQMFLESLTPYESYEVGHICEKYGIENWSISNLRDASKELKNYIVDVDGSVNLSYKHLYKLPLLFGKVSGNFNCGNNNLESLEGSPEEVGSNFYCNNNKLKTLKGCPKEVGGTFNCRYNWLRSLEGLVYAREFNAGDVEPLKVYPITYNPISVLTKIGQTMITQKISFLEAVSLNRTLLSDKEIILIMKDIEPQKILDLNDFKVFNVLRTQVPEKYAEVMKLRNIDLSTDLGELGF